jgi:very-short-patch-repair endonuclease
MLRTRVQRGLWLPIDTGVYAAASSLPTWRRSVMAAVLAEPWAVASHRTGAVLHGLDGFRPGRPHVTIRPGANARGKLSVAHRGVDVAVTKVDDIPVVTVAQVFIDISQVVSEGRLRACLAARADTSPSVLDAVRDRFCDLAPRGGRDLRPLRRVLSGFGAGVLPDVSELERQLRRVLQDRRIPPVEWEARFPGRQSGPQRVDGLIPAWTLVVEADGRSWHTRTEDFERDRRRDAEAAAAGYQTLRFTWHQLVHEAAWVQDVVISAGGHRRVA